MYPHYNYIGEKQCCEQVPIAFPKQHQPIQPGLEYLMDPRPISENPAVLGSQKLAGKVAIISGGDSGIGRAVAYLFAKEGADIVIVYYNETVDANETRQRILELGQQCLLIMGDLSEEETSKRVVQLTMDEFGHIDLLVNNCAVQFLQPSLLDISEAQLDLTFRTNLYSYFFLTKAVLPFLKPGSSIINTTSVTAYQGNKQLIDYSATKGAIVAFTRSLSQSLVEQGIRVNGVAPGPIWTPLTPATYPAEDVSTFGTATPKVPMMRAGQPFEIAPSYLFLASDDSRYMSGQILHPNGGTIVDS